MRKLAWVFFKVVLPGMLGVRTRTDVSLILHQKNLMWSLFWSISYKTLPAPALVISSGQKKNKNANVKLKPVRPTNATANPCSVASIAANHLTSGWLNGAAACQRSNWRVTAPVMVWLIVERGMIVSRLWKRDRKVRGLFRRGESWLWFKKRARILRKKGKKKRKSRLGKRNWWRRNRQPLS